MAPSRPTRGFVLVSLLGGACARRNVQAQPSDLHVRLEQFGRTPLAWRPEASNRDRSRFRPASPRASSRPTEALASARARSPIYVRADLGAGHISVALRAAGRRVVGRAAAPRAHASCAWGDARAADGSHDPQTPVRSDPDRIGR